MRAHRFVLVAALLAMVACGGSSSDTTPSDASVTDSITVSDSLAPPNDADASTDAPTQSDGDATVPPKGCVPTTCLAVGAQCGSIDDGCGGTIDCGSTCFPGGSCGASAPNVCGHEWFLAPSGDDAGDGSRAHPWKTFAHAWSKIVAGDVLVLLDGTYTRATNGELVADCGATSGPTKAPNGTATAPITVRADHSRHAYLQGDGTAAGPVYLHACSYWNVVGLRASSKDAVGTGVTSVFEVDHSDHVTLYRIFGWHDNRMYNTQVVALDYSSDCAVIEAEVYDFHRHGIEVFSPVAERNVVQRSYVDGVPGGTCDSTATSEGAVHCGWDLTCDTSGKCGGITGSESFCTAKSAGSACGWPSHTAKFGDEGVTNYWSRDGFTENCITLDSEGQQATGHANVIESGVSLHDFVGVSLGRNQNGEGSEATIGEGSNVAKDMLLVAPLDGDTRTNWVGVRMCGGNGDEARSITTFGGNIGVIGVGYLPTGVGTYCQPAQTGLPMKWLVSDIAIFAPGGEGALAEGTMDDPWGGDAMHVWTTKAGVPAYDRKYPSTPVHWTHADVGAVTGGFDATTAKGDLVFVPSTSSLHRAGPSGEDIGANVTCLWDHGKNTGKPMWNAADGRFTGCDWYAAGGADDFAASSGFTHTCAHVHEAIDVGTNGGTIPACMP